MSNADKILLEKDEVIDEVYLYISILHIRTNKSENLHRHLGNHNKHKNTNRQRPSRCLYQLNSVNVSLWQIYYKLKFAQALDITPYIC